MKINYAYNLLFNKIPIIICKNNHKIFVSKSCPFCNYNSKNSNVFRYNLKLNVGKSYCCGESFKNKSKLIKLLKLSKDKLDAKDRRFENVYYDDNLPF